MFLFLIIGLAISQYGYPPAQPLFTLVRDNTFCKNRGTERDGELSVADIVVLDNPSRTIQGCAQSAESSRQRSMCSETFFATSSTNQCACLRPGRECKEEESSTGLSMYRLNVLGGQQGFGPVCGNLKQRECELNLSCTWRQISCVQTQLEGARAAGQPYGTVPSTPFVAGTPGNMMAGQPMQTLNMPPPKLVAGDAKCDEEIEEGTGQSNILNLNPSMTLNDCQAQVQAAFSRGACTTFFVYKEMVGYASDCTCVRAGGTNSVCDVDDHLPGFIVYELKTTGTPFFPQGSTSQMYPPQPGMQKYPNPTGPVPAYGTNPGAHGAYNPGFAAQPGMATQPGLMTQPGMIPQPGMAPGMATQPGMASGMSTQPGMLNQPIGAQPGAYQPMQGFGAPATGYQQGFGTNPHAFNGRIGGQLQKSHELESTSKPTSATAILVLLFSSFFLGVAVGLCIIIYRSRQKNNREILL